MECIKCNGKCVKNGKLKSGKQQYKCKECGKQFTENAEKKYISHGEWEVVERLLLEKISIAGISRATKISETHLQKYVNKKYDNVKKIENSCKMDNSERKIVVECDEMWSFVGKKANKAWIWLAMD